VHDVDPPDGPVDSSRVTYAYSPAVISAVTMSVAPAPTLIFFVTFRVVVLSTVTTLVSKVAM
jgi:hypothetical protein